MSHSDPLKKCSKCGVEKPRLEFYVQSRIGDRLCGKCKDCTKTDVKAYRSTHRDQILSLEKRRQRTPKRKALNARWPLEHRQESQAIKRNWAQRNREKKTAVYTVNNAIRDGRLKRKPCEICGKFEAEGHHEDYALPLEVIWLCSTCHAAHHVHKRLIDKFWNRVRAKQRAAINVPFGPEAA